MWWTQSTDCSNRRESPSSTVLRRACYRGASRRHSILIVIKCGNRTAVWGKQKAHKQSGVRLTGVEQLTVLRHDANTCHEDEQSTHVLLVVPHIIADWLQEWFTHIHSSVWISQPHPTLQNVLRPECWHGTQPVGASAAAAGQGL